MKNQEQLKLWKFDKCLYSKPTISLKPPSNYLEYEKSKFIAVMCSFIDNLNFETFQLIGRPKADFKDIVKSLLIMSFNGMSYRRTQSDLRKMQEDSLILYSPPRSTLNDYCNNEQTIAILEKLIQASALFFTDNENTLILDSTWLATRMYLGGHKRVYDKAHTPFKFTRKLHVSILKNSKVIAFAKATSGEISDFNIFEQMVRQPIENGFEITSLLADSGYSSKQNYALCKELEIFDAFIDFRSNVTGKRAKSDLWREKVKLFKEQKSIWHESYKYRALVEGVFSAIKRKMINYLRSRNEIAQDVELLLKCLVYNLTVMGKYS